MRRRGRLVTGVLVLVALVLVMASSAVAATPRAIYMDLADNGRLDKSYSAAEMKAFLADTTVQGYSNPVVAGVSPAASNANGAAGVAAVNQSGALPFTGAQLSIFVIIGAALLAAGLLLRATGRKKTTA